MSVHDTQNESTREAALAAATEAIGEGRLIVLPTDTVYGIGADAFSRDAVADLLEAKGRGRDVPPPVLVADPAVLLALAVDVPEYVERLTEEFWPGPLTLILNAQPSLAWDLGETRGTVALRMPEDATALELLRRTGPLAVSSANRHGKPAAGSVMDAATQLGDAVEVYLDGGPARLGTSSTIIDTTVEPPEIVRDGALSKERIIEAVGDIFATPEPEPETLEPKSSEPKSSEPESSEPEWSEPETPQPGSPHSASPDSPSSEPEGEVGDDGGSEASGEGDATDGVLDLPSEEGADIQTLGTTSAEADHDVRERGPHAPREGGSRDG